jgi:ATP-dependent helicase HrpB
MPSARIAFCASLEPGWPPMGDADLLASLDRWLGPHVDGMRRMAELQRLDLHALLLQHLTWEQRRALDELAPERIAVPTGSMIAIDYGDPSAPSLSVRLQEVFGMQATPRVGRGRVAVVMHLLSPAYRPVQVTRDLESFWKTGYFDVRKDLRGRYPKHHWPDDPATATAVRGAKRR